MVHLPKDIILQAMNSKEPKKFIEPLLEHTRTHLTCRAMAQYVFDTVGFSNPKRVLFLSGETRPDYLRCLTLIGMKQILGSNCAESVCIPHIYEDYPKDVALYSKGFTYSRILPVSSKPQPIHINEVIEGSFDLVVYGSIHRGMPYWNEVTSSYPPSKIILLCGEDCDANTPNQHVCFGKELAQKGFNVFIRELGNDV
jgi:hypothetical protein